LKKLFIHQNYLTLILILKIKKMKKIITLLIGFCFVYSLNAQTCEFYIPSQIGKKITTEYYDSKSKLTGYGTSEVISVSETSNGTEIVIEVENFDKKSESSGKSRLKYYCRGDVFEVDMNSFISPEQMAGFENMKIETQAHKLAYPSVLVPGMKLEDGFVETVIYNEGIKIMTLRVDVTNIIVEAVEEITVPAGTFTAYKISSDITSKTGFMTMNFKSVQWIVKNLGVIRNESYNKKGNLNSYSIVSKIE